MAWDVPEDKSSRDGFYVTPDCCRLCGIPVEVAPDIFHMTGRSCFVRKQPSSAEELDRTIDAIMQTDVNCVRYGGKDEAILRRFGEAEMPYRADDPSAYEHKPLINDIVRFLTAPVCRAASAAAWANRLSSYLRAEGRFTVRAPSFFHRTVKFSWYGPSFHAVRFRAGGKPDEWIAAVHPDPVRGIRGVTRVLRDWLHADPDVLSIHWHTAESLAAGEPGMATPY